MEASQITPWAWDIIKYYRYCSISRDHNKNTDAANRTFFTNDLLSDRYITLWFWNCVISHLSLRCRPRDGLMVGICQRFHLSINVVRSSLEISVCLLGFTWWCRWLGHCPFRHQHRQRCSILLKYYCSFATYSV